MSHQQCYTNMVIHGHNLAFPPFCDQKNALLASGGSEYVEVILLKENRCDENAVLPYIATFVCTLQSEFSLISRSCTQSLVCVQAPESM